MLLLPLLPLLPPPSLLLPLLLFPILLLLLLRSRRKKKLALEAGEIGEGELTADGEGLVSEDGELLGGEGMEGSNMHRMPGAPEDEEEDEFAKNEEILNLRMQRSLRLKQNISEFVDQNPQIAAKLIQSWLRGEEDLGDARRKQSK